MQVTIWYDSSCQHYHSCQYVHRGCSDFLEERYAFQRDFDEFMDCNCRDYLGTDVFTVRPCMSLISLLKTLVTILCWLTNETPCLTICYANSYVRKLENNTSVQPSAYLKLLTLYSDVKHRTAAPWDILHIDKCRLKLELKNGLMSILMITVRNKVTASQISANSQKKNPAYRYFDLDRDVRREKSAHTESFRWIPNGLLVQKSCPRHPAKICATHSN